MTAAEVVLSALRDEPYLTVPDLCWIVEKAGIKVSRSRVYQILDAAGVKAAPARPKAKRKPEQIVVRVGAGEKKKITAAAKRARKVPSDWIRESLLATAEEEKKNSRPGA
jgi:hypothetical protein